VPAAGRTRTLARASAHGGYNARMLRGEPNAYEATCDRCMRPSGVVAAATMDGAREALVTQGWTFVARGEKATLAYCPDHKHAKAVAVTKPVMLLFLIALAVGGWFLVQRLWEISKLQDCLMTGRKNCMPIDTSSAR
jgi:hypothetical protein